jgi:hypothetical protein
MQNAASGSQPQGELAATTRDSRVERGSLSPERGYVSVKEHAAERGCSVATIYRLVKRQALPCEQPGGPGTKHYIVRRPVLPPLDVEVSGSPDNSEKPPVAPRRRGCSQTKWNQQMASTLLSKGRW